MKALLASFKLVVRTIYRATSRHDDQLNER